MRLIGLGRLVHLGAPAALCCLLAAAWPVAAQPSSEPACRPLASGTARARAVEFCLDSWSAPVGQTHSAVLEPSYWERVRVEQHEFEMRFGLHAMRGLAFESFVVTESATPIRTSPASAVSPHLSAVERFAGLRWERDNVLLPGDRVTARAASEVQVLARAAGLIQSSEQAEALALLGLRSRLQLAWELGEPERRIQWQLVTRLDRRRDEANETISLRATRRF
jgi:hypothetical protein